MCLFSLSVPVLEIAQQGSSDTHITLDVVANDKSGRPVSGLEQQDFTVFDNKQARKILSFQAIDGPAAAAPVEIILIVDSVNTSFNNVGYEREQIDKFLRQDGGKLALPVSLAFFSDFGLNLQGAPSRDGNALVAYLDHNETALRTIRRSQGFYGAADRSQLSVRAVVQLAQQEQNRPGRKIVIWVSPGWPLLSGPEMQLTPKDEQQIFNTIVGISTQLRQSRITLYSLDPLGTLDSGGFRTFYYEQFLKGVISPRQALLGDLGLQVFAYQSGGRVLNSNNNVAGEIETCVRDANAYYVLSFDAPPADGPNEYHALEVKIGRPGLKAQTRSGYYAQPVRPPQAPQAPNK